MIPAGLPRKGGICNPSAKDKQQSADQPELPRPAPLAHLASPTAFSSFLLLKYFCIALACWRWYSRVTPLRQSIQQGEPYQPQPPLVHSSLPHNTLVQQLHSCRQRAAVGRLTWAQVPPPLLQVPPPTQPPEPLPPPGAQAWEEWGAPDAPAASAPDHWWHAPPPPAGSQASAHSNQKTSEHRTLGAGL